MDHMYIYLVFSKTGTWLSRAINRIGNIKYPHSSISFDESFSQMYSFGRINPNNPFSGGFVVESFYDGVFKKFSNCQCLIYRVRITKDQYAALQQEINSFLEKKENYSFNFLGLFGVIAHMPLKRKNKYFCSQFVSEVLIKSSVLKCDKIPELVSTKDLYFINDKEVIFEGMVRDYNQKIIS